MKATTKRTIANVRHAFSGLREIADMDFGYEVACEMKRPTLRLHIACYLGALWQAIKYAECELRGHPGPCIDEGYATPDSGCIDIVCRRCGANICHAILY